MTQNVDISADETTLVEVEPGTTKEKAPAISTLAAFETDPDAEIGGVNFTDPSTGVTLVIAHNQNKRYRDYLQSLIRPYIQVIQSNSPRGAALLRKLEAKALARFVLLGWSGLTDEDGEEIPYSIEKAQELLLVPRWRKFRNLVDIFSSDDTAFGPDRVEMGKDSADGFAGS